MNQPGDTGSDLTKNEGNGLLKWETPRLIRLNSSITDAGYNAPCFEVGHQDCGYQCICGSPTADPSEYLGTAGYTS